MASTDKACVRMLLLLVIRRSIQKYELRTGKQFIESLKMTLIMLDVKTTFGNIVRDQSVSICMLHNANKVLHNTIVVIRNIYCVTRQSSSGKLAVKNIRFCTLLTII